jgi:hypothetical protein
MKRVDAYLSSLGYCSRSEAKKFLKQNEVLFSENRVFNPSTKVKHDNVLVNGEKLDSEKITILMNKPSGVICSHNDSGVLIYSLLPRRWQNRNPKISTNIMWQNSTPDYINILEIENFDDFYEIEKPKIERVYKECDVMITHINPSVKDENMNSKYKNKEFDSYDQI